MDNVNRYTYNLRIVFKVVLFQSNESLIPTTINQSFVFNIRLIIIGGQH